MLDILGEIVFYFIAYTFQKTDKYVETLGLRV